MSANSGIKHPFYKGGLLKLLIKALVFAIVIVFLSNTLIGIISLPINLTISSYFTSLTFIVNFLILIVLMAIYDYITARRMYLYETFFGILTFSILFSFASNIALLFVLSLVGLYIGFLIGSSLRYVATKSNNIRILGGVIIFLTAIFFVYILVLHTNYYTPPTTVSNVYLPYLTKAQLNNVFGGGLYSENPLNVGEAGMGSSLYVFSTPIQEALLFNVSLANVGSNGGYLITFYNATFLNNGKVVYANITGQTWNTNQASLIFSQEARSLTKVNNTYLKIGNQSDTQYILEGGLGNNSTTPNFLIVAQNANYLVFLSCYGVLCTQHNAELVINQTSTDLG